jgi:hypothetical protein
MKQQAKPVNIMRICADRILQRMEFMSAGVYLSEHDFEELSAQLETILDELHGETSLARLDLIDFCADHCDMEMSSHD